MCVARESDGYHVWPRPNVIYPPQPEQGPATNLGFDVAVTKIETKLNQPTIAQMTVGQSRYTEPWAIWQDTHTRLWLNRNYPTTLHPMSTQDVLVKRLADGYHVWYPAGSSHRPHAADPYPGQARAVFIPVTVSRLN
jgi:hypothetical protein